MYVRVMEISDKNGAMVIWAVFNSCEHVDCESVF